MSGRPPRNRFRFRLLTLILLALIGGLGSCLGRSGEPQPPLADPSVSAGPVVAATSPSTSRPAAVTESTVRSATRTRATSTSATPRRDLVPDVDDVPVLAPRPTTRSSAREQPADEAVYFQNCAAVRAAGAAPVRRGDPGYRAASTATATARGAQATELLTVIALWGRYRPDVAAGAPNR